MESLSCERLVIGAGVIGLAAAARIANQHCTVLEAHGSFGKETSSRNSEVIHSGIYYPAESKKTQLCIEGRERLYCFVKQHGIAFQACGKLTVAVSDTEQAYLETLAAHCQHLDVPYQRVSSEMLRRIAPEIHAQVALFFPQSGIVDSHGLMAVLERQVLEKGATIAYGHRAVSARKTAGGWSVALQGPHGPIEIEARTVVNAAGLAAAHLSNSALQTKKYEHRFCRGRYFQLSSGFGGKFKNLVYPVPQKDGLGVHVTIDLAGQARLGPDIDWCAESDLDDVSKYYDCDWESLRAPFAAAAGRYLTGLKPSDLTPGLIGIRPKLFINGNAHPDFLIENQDGWIHCLGMESPGLTAALAIATQFGF